MLRLLTIFLILASMHSLAQNRQANLRSTNKIGASVLKNLERVNSVNVLCSDTTTFLSWLIEHCPNLKPLTRYKTIFTFNDCTSAQINVIATCPAVVFIDRGTHVANEETVLGEFDMTLNAVSSLHHYFPSINGKDITISIKEKPFDVNDIDLRGRVIINKHFDESPSLHATIMATVAAGAGNISSSGRGAAPAALITSSDFESLLPDDHVALASEGVSVQNHSYGVGIENYYGVESFAYDMAVKENPKLLHVFSSGNEGDQIIQEGMYAGIPGVANLTGQFKLSKNTFCVGSSDRYGNVMSRSSRGPAHDGRVKPEVIAFGDAGSSEAAALVSGVSATIQQQYKSLHGVLPDAALVKAIIINTAHDVNRPHVDYETGFGSVNALAAVKANDEGRFFFGQVGPGSMHTSMLKVPSGIQKLKITLVWDDLPGELGAPKALLNNLDISLTTPDGDLILPWILDPTPHAINLQTSAHRGIDTLNNVEQITLDNPLAGDYNVTIKGQGLNDIQTFYVAHEFMQGFSWIHPLLSSPLQSGENNIIRWMWHGGAATASLHFRFSGSEEWNEVAPAIEMENQFFDWVATDTSALIQFRFTTMDGVEYLSEEVIVQRQLHEQVGYVCSGDVMIYWPPMENATGFHLYALGEKYLEPVGFTTDTLFVVDSTANKTQFYSVAPAFGERIGDKSRLIDFTEEGVGCYFRSFLARESVVSEKAVFDVSLGTTYGLKSATLERLVEFDQFIFVDAINDLRSLLFSVEDLTALSGMHTYRVRLETEDGEVFYSDNEVVLFINERDVYIYPNPAHTTDEVSVIVQDESVAVMKVYDVRGTFLRSDEDFGVVKIIDPLALPPGLYIVELTTDTGKRYHTRLVMQ